MADRAEGIPIVPEGVPFIGAFAVPAFLLRVLGWRRASLALGAGAAFTTWFFRNPRRVAPPVAGAVLAPADGRIIGVEEVFEPRYLKDQSLRFSIFLNIFDVHVNRVPCPGVVEQIVYQPGEFLAANREDAGFRNEQNAVMLRTKDDRKVLFVQVAGLVARRIVCWLSPGEHVLGGERMGLIRFGSRMDTYVPLGSVPQVAVGCHVRGGETILAQLPCADR